MTLPVPSFFALTAGNQPLSLLDQQFAAIAVTGALPCAATGTNTLVLTPNTTVYVPTAYTTGLKVVWIQPITTVSGAVTINVAGLGPITAFRNNGQTALGFGDLVGGCIYTGTFSASLSSGNGGFSVDVLGTAGAGSGAGAVATVSDTPPVSPVNGQLWFDSVGQLMYVFYVDPTSSQWVNINNYGLASGTGGGGGGGGGGGVGIIGTYGGIDDMFKNLSIQVPSGTTVTVTADAVVTFNGSTTYTTLQNINSSINATITGVNGIDTGAVAVNTWYAVWIISGNAGQAAVMSLSSAIPTLPSGYTSYARVGWVQTAPTTTTLVKTQQLGRKAQYVVTGTAPNTALPLLFEGTSGTITGATFTGTSIAVAPGAPPTASILDFVLSAAGTNIDVAMAPNANYKGYQDANNPVPWVMHGIASTNSLRTSFMLEGTHVFFASSGASGSAQSLGWEDNL